MTNTFCVGEVTDIVVNFMMNLYSKARYTYIERIQQLRPSINALFLFTFVYNLAVDVSVIQKIDNGRNGLTAQKKTFDYNM